MHGFHLLPHPHPPKNNNNSNDTFFQFAILYMVLPIKIQ